MDSFFIQDSPCPDSESSMVFKDGCSVMSVYHHIQFLVEHEHCPPNTDRSAHLHTYNKHTYIIHISMLHTYIHTYTYVRTYASTDVPSFVHSFMHACIHAFMHSSANYEGQFRVQYLVLGAAIECMNKLVMGCTSNWPIPCKINCCWKYARGRH